MTANMVHDMDSTLLTNEVLKQQVEQATTEVKEHMANKQFDTCLVYADGEVYDTYEDISWKSDDYIVIDSVETLDLALSQFNDKQKLDVLNQMGIELQLKI